MVNRQTFYVIATGLILAAGIYQAVAAQTEYEVPVRLILGGEVIQLADESQNWAIRPAEETTPISRTQSQDGASLMGAPIAEGSSQIESDGAIRYVSGGIGESERHELDALSKEFNLHLMFATQGSGEYLSAVQVTILDSRERSVLTAESKGPWFFAQLPPGDYSVEVTPTGLRGHGDTQRRTVHLDSSNRSKMDFYWNK